MTKYLMILAALMLMIACDSGDTKSSEDNEPVNDDATVNDTTEQPDNTVDTEQPEVDNYVTPDDFGAMIDVPAGEFQMGCNSAVDDQCGSDEFPYHAVTLSAYKIGKYEVTVGEYQQCVTNGACNNSGDYYHYYTNTDYLQCNLGTEGKDNHPMQCVTWYGAKAYCEYIGQRLPTEAEWEKAARGTDGRKYPWGNENATCDYAVMDDDNAGGDGCGSGGTMPIGSKESGKSPYGAYDMAGNVWEWVKDWYSETYYETSPTNNPAGPETGDSRVLRGGSWSDGYGVGNGAQRASLRSGGYPGGRNFALGFRCVKDVE